MTGVSDHPIAGIFPLMGANDLAALAADISENGLREKIVLHSDGRIIDGRNRHRACIAAGVTPRFQTHRGADETLAAYVISLNLHRRHLNESQRAMVAASLANLEDGQRADQVGASIDAPAVSQAEAASNFGVGRASVQRAKKVRIKGVPELVEAVEVGGLAVSVAAKIADQDADAQRFILESGNPHVALKKQERSDQVTAIAARAKNTGPLVSGEIYNVLYVDPPWQNVVWSEETGHGKSPEKHYDTMTLDDIKAVPVAELAEKDAVLFLWTTANRVHWAIDVLSAWGFDYRSQFIWDKVDIGMGRWVRDQHEVLLIAARGKGLPAPAPGTQSSSVVSIKKGRHSEKPKEFRQLIDTYYPGIPKIELFARGAVPEGWRSWGNEAEANDKVLTSPPTAADREQVDAVSAESKGYPPMPASLDRNAKAEAAQS